MVVIRNNSANTGWTERYGRRHGYVRLADEPALPNGRRGRVTIYRRGQISDTSRTQAFILSWCYAGRRRKERVVGDKFAAVRRADEINASVEAGTIRSGPVQVALRDIVARYVDYLSQRVDAGEISPATPQRYRSALRHLTRFAERDMNGKAGKGWVSGRAFVLRFKTHLRNTMITSNGHPNTRKRPIAGKGRDFILASARTLIRWAAQERLMPPESVHAFAQPNCNRVVEGTLSRLPITRDEVIRLVQAADLYQLGLFSFHIFHGVRVAEPCWLMIESFDSSAGWAEYRCLEALAYRTKGAVDKRIPVPEPMVQVLLRLVADRTGGPLVIKRRLIEGDPRPDGARADLASIIQRVQTQAPAGWSERARTARAFLRRAGMISGDDVRREFSHLLRSAGLHRDVTPKAFRHHFATALELADVPYYTRKYLLGHRLGAKGTGRGDVTALYTHLEPGPLKAMYQRVLDGPFAPVVDAFTKRLMQLSDTHHPFRRVSADSGKSVQQR